jgi:hypothetical protein
LATLLTLLDLQDKFTLAHYNIANGAILVLGVRERGGRGKK